MIMAATPFHSSHFHHLWAMSSSSKTSSSSYGSALKLNRYCYMYMHMHMYDYDCNLNFNYRASFVNGGRRLCIRHNRLTFRRNCGFKNSDDDVDEKCLESDEIDHISSVDHTSSDSGSGGGGERGINKGVLATVLQGISLSGGEANSAIVSACFVGLLTGLSVVLFNYLVHELRDFCWDGVLYRGASWLREEPLEKTWKRTIFVPVCGGLLVSLLNLLRDSLDAPEGGFIMIPQIKAVLQQFLRSLAACVTLGTGNSLGPEGPSVEIGSSIGKGVASLSGRSTGKKVPLVAAGSAAGIASGFNAAVAGCFFAVESVLWPSPDTSATLTNTTSMVILSAVIASVLSEVGLGAEPAFKVPNYDFRSASELPLYLLLGILCGLVSLALTRCTTFMLHEAEEIKKAGRVPKVVFPITGGLAVGLMALAYPEILYWGFQNVDILLESRPFVKGLSADLLVQLVGVKIIATSFCRASGLVGGYYAPSLFIGAATGMAYGKLIALAVSECRPIFQFSFIEVASPQAYGLVGMAATLAGVCQVPLTSVLLLFELTQDYRIVVPLLAAVGTSSWITSPRIRRTDLGNDKKANESALKIQESDASNKNTVSLSSGHPYPTKTSNIDNICEIESSSCFDDSDTENEEAERRIFVSQAMRTRFATVLQSTSLLEAVNLMLAEKQSYALIVNKDNHLMGLLSLEDILEFSKSAQTKKRKPESCCHQRLSEREF
ncbi:chloride channel protein CLC-e isoform X2 [Beta vulgaris subsp. vulgaris]|uniref:chloride channel protein CLC-e isoform X2 n=1 Tax=Beta vulgaris subsp. vulgaris TaxID=3555 RepID=UPI002036C5C0|nr:chloride channel protein CLC-e isoform X2 [Beta vulgaris subsp. vulgaris]